MAWNSYWYAGSGNNADNWIDFELGGVIELTGVRMSVQDRNHTIHIYDYDDETGEETLIKDVPVYKVGYSGDGQNYQIVEVPFRDVQTRHLRFRVTDSNGAFSISEIHPYCVALGAGLKRVVASIGTAGYDTLAAALAAATDGQTIVLEEDVEEDVRAVSDKRVTINLSGWTWTIPYSTVAVRDAGSLTLRNGTVAIGDAVRTAFEADGSGSGVTLENGVSMSVDDQRALGARNGGACVVAGATVTYSAASFASTVLVDGPNASVSVRSGYFSTQVPDAFCAVGCHSALDPDGQTGLYKVASAWKVTFVNTWSSTPKPQVLFIGDKPTLHAAEPDDTEFKSPSFLGWFAPGSIEPFDFENTPITSDLTLTARWNSSMMLIR